MAEAASGAGAPRARVRLLIASDAASARAFAAGLHTCEPGGFESFRARSLEHALALLQRSSFDVLLVDLAAEEGAVLDTLARAHAAASRVPIIVVAGREDEGDSVQALRLGAQDYLARDLSDPRALIRSIRHALERHRLLAELQGARQREHFMATHDALTGLANRFAFNEQLDRALAHAKRNRRHLAVFFLDLDDFKYINDNLGHSVGDLLLRQAAERLRAELRKTDVVSRIGGDEFIAMIQDLDRDQSAARVAGKLIESLAAPFVLHEREYWITASVGIATFPRDGSDRETLVRHADAAMYHAKDRGKNNVQFYSDALNEVSRRRLTIERALRRAFEHGRLEVHYQPTVELATGRITGAEALLRWHDPDLGTVSPQDFVPLAEETGLIRRIGAWVLRTACEQARRWSDAGFAVGVSVNVSAQQLRGDALREGIARTLWDTGLAPSQLALEITEGTLMDADAANALREIKSIGVGVSLDDFGTGFSSLSYLKFVPIDSVKIDQSFVSDIAVDPDDAAIVAAVLSIADQLRLRVVAEGVETQEQRQFLLARGCHEMQGFLFSPALPGDEFLELLRKRSQSS